MFCFFVPEFFMWKIHMGSKNLKQLLCWSILAAHFLPRWADACSADFSSASRRHTGHLSAAFQDWHGFTLCPAKKLQIVSSTLAQSNHVLMRAKCLGNKLLGNPKTNHGTIGFAKQERRHPRSNYVHSVDQKELFVDILYKAGMKNI